MVIHLAQGRVDHQDVQYKSYRELDRICIERLDGSTVACVQVNHQRRCLAAPALY